MCFWDIDYNFMNKFVEQIIIFFSRLEYFESPVLSCFREFKWRNVQNINK